MQFICLEDIIVLNKVIAHKDEILELNQTIQKETISIVLDESFLSNEKLFRKLKEVNVKSKEFEAELEDFEKEWIIELKITASRRKLREIENFLRLEITKMLS